jgi:hypothetical protein
MNGLRGSTFVERWTVVKCDDTSAVAPSPAKACDKRHSASPRGTFYAPRGSSSRI